MKNHEITLEEMLDQREYRVYLINTFIEKYPNKTIVSYKLNIPGPIKNNSLYRYAFLKGLNSIPYDLIDKLIFLDNKTGPEAILVIDKDNNEVKKTLVKIENRDDLGRLFDLDVVGVNRSDLNIDPRKCLICEDMAHSCARSKKHSLIDVLSAIEKIIRNVYNEDIRNKKNNN